MNRPDFSTNFRRTIRENILWQGSLQEEERHQVDSTKDNLLKLKTRQRFIQHKLQEACRYAGIMSLTFICLRFKIEWDTRKARRQRMFRRDQLPSAEKFRFPQTDLSKDKKTLKVWEKIESNHKMPESVDKICVLTAVANISRDSASSLWSFLQIENKLCF